MSKTRFPVSVSCVAQAVTVAAAGDVSSQAADPNGQEVVAGIGDCTITKDDLSQRLLQEIRPRGRSSIRRPNR